MQRTLTMLFTSVSFLTATVSAAEKPVKMKDLPPAVQKAVQAQMKSATVKGISKEVVNGKTVYEVETITNGKTRDLILDDTGAVVEVEQEVALDSIPAEAKAAIEKGGMGGKITKVETVTKGQDVSYEAAITKKGKSSEITVKADGSRVK